MLAGTLISLMLSNSAGIQVNKGLFHSYIKQAEINVKVLLQSNRLKRAPQECIIRSIISFMDLLFLSIIHSVTIFAVVIQKGYSITIGPNKQKMFHICKNTPRETDAKSDPVSRWRQEIEGEIECAEFTSLENLSEVPRNKELRI